MKKQYKLPRNYNDLEAFTLRTLSVLEDVVSDQKDEGYVHHDTVKSAREVIAEVDPVNPVDQYFAMYDKVQRGAITQEVWADYCLKLLGDIMEQPELKAVFMRLKNCD